MKFAYKAKKNVDEVVDGSIEADNKNDALNILIERGLYPISVDSYHEQSVVSAAKETGIIKHRRRFRKRISSKDIIFFFRNLKTLTKSRVDLLHSLKIIANQSENTGLSVVMNQIVDSVGKGESFSEAMRKFPNIFSPLFVSIIRAGEASGRIDTALEQIDFYLSKKQLIRNKITTALAYPSVLLLMGIVSVFVIITFVVPRLKPMFENMGVGLPFITRFILNLSGISYRNWIVVAGLSGVLFIFIYYNRKGRHFQRLLAWLKESIPFVKKIIKNQNLVQFSLSLDLLIRNNVQVLSALQIARFTVDNPILQEELAVACEKIKQGHKISDSLKVCNSLPDFFIKMVSVGEESGNMDVVLNEISQAYMQEVENDTAIISSLIEPVLIIILGIVLGSIIISILLPMFEITKTIS